MTPSSLLLKLLAVWSGLALVLAALRIGEMPIEFLSSVWLYSGIALGLVAVVDALSFGPGKQLHITRTVPGSLALGVATKIKLYLVNHSHRTLQFTLAEAPNAKLTVDQLPTSLALKPSETCHVNYTLTPIGRGDVTLDQLYIRYRSRWSLWRFRVKAAEVASAKIYPNFSPIAFIASLGLEQQIQQLGIHLAQRRGEGMEFKQLREFVEGDALRQIDWKAMARYRKPISREYQDERNQDIFFLLDCGRRLRHKDGDLSHFDHALNAILLTSYIAINQGDSAGLCSFAGAERWLSPVNGVTGVNQILNLLYDLESTTQNSDFLQLAENFASRHRRRSLVIIVSNIREEDSDDLIRATRLLAKTHVVMVASLREQILDDSLKKPVNSFSDALNYSASHDFMASRRQLMRQLTSAGVVVVDALPDQLHIKLVDEYLRLKRSHRL